MYDDVTFRVNIRAFDRTENFYVALRENMKAVPDIAVNADCTREVHAANSEVYILMNVKLRQDYEFAVFVL